jgi:beta-lactamase superfamily II metal-dependent hydrolase/DNA/RNA endonuclease YhcR with UshA esterase domain
MKTQPFIVCLVSILLVLFIPSTRSQEGLLRIYFVDIGQGHATLIVSPTGKTLLVDGGPEGSGSAAIVPLMRSLGLARLDTMVATHYDGDHIGGLDEVAAAFPPTIAYDGGDATGAFGPLFTQYLNAIRPVRTAIRPGTVIDLGGGAWATCIVVNGNLISGGRVNIFGRTDNFDQRDNSASIGLLVQYGDFDFFVSGDLSGGGNNTTDVESTVAQLVGDVDVVQLNHHGSSTSSNPTYLNTLKPEVAVVQAGRSNSFGHPTIEIMDRVINTTPTSGIAPTPPDRDQPPTPLRPPVAYQTEPSPSSSIASDQALVAGGTFSIQTDGRSYEVSGGLLSPTTFPTDGAETGIRSDFPPSVVLTPSAVVPATGQVLTLVAVVSDDSRLVDSVAMSYSANDGERLPLEVKKNSTVVYSAVIPGQPDGTLIQYRVTGRDGAGQQTEAAGGYFAGTTSVQSLRVNDALGLPRYLGFPARIAGSVTVPTGSFSQTSTNVYIQDASGGVNVFESGGQTTSVALGDQVTITGRLAFFNGILELEVTNPITYAPFSSPFGITKNSSGVAPTPVVMTVAEIGESVEGLLVRIDRVNIVSGSIPSSGNANLTITDGTAQTTLRVLGNTDIPGLTAPSGSFSVVGVVSQFDGFRPSNRGYQLLPRSRADFIAGQSLGHRQDSKIAKRTSTSTALPFRPSRLSGKRLTNR